MAGRRRRAVPPPPPPPPPPQQDAEPSPLADAAPASREVTIVERPSKNTCYASGSTSSISSAPHVFADLLDSLLHEIIALFNSCHDFLAFIGTCRSWRVAVSSVPSVHIFSFPPLHLKPDGPYVLPHTRNLDPILLSDCKWQLSDPSKKNLSLRCSVPQNTPNAMDYLGCSYGYLIFSYEEHCLLVNVLTGTKVKPPKLPPNNNLGYLCGIGILTAAISSPNSSLLLCSETSIFQWRVGTNSWSEHPLAIRGERIHQMLLFNGDIFALDNRRRLRTIHLVPEFSLQEVAMMWEWESMPRNPWLVVSGGNLLMVDISAGSDELNGEPYGIFEIFRLDFSVKPAKRVKMEKLENQAVFVSLDPRNPTFSCKNPERWGGKSNCVYVANLFPDETWTMVELGQRVRRNICHCLYYGCAFQPDCSLLSSLWAFPSSNNGFG